MRVRTGGSMKVSRVFLVSVLIESDEPPTFNSASSLIESDVSHPRK